MTADERQKLNEAMKNIASVRNALVFREDYSDIRIMERIINEIATLLENDDDRKHRKETNK